MNDRIENKISSLYKLRTYFHHQLASLAVTVPALSGQVAVFNTQLDELETIMMVAIEVTTGYRTQKHYHRQLMCDMGLAISAALYALATVDANKDLQTKTNLTKGYVYKKRDTDLLFWAEGIASLGATHAAQLLAMGIGPSLHTDFAVQTLAFRENLNGPAQSRAATKDAKIAAKQHIALMDKTMALLDALMVAASYSHSQQYLHYQFSRRIDDNR